jgi:predicted secreted protein
MPDPTGREDAGDEPTPDARAARLAEAAGCTPAELLAEVERIHRLADALGAQQAMQQLAAEAGLTPEELQLEMEKLSALESPN